MNPNDTAMASGCALPLCSRDMGVFHLLWSSSAVALQQVLQQQQNPDKTIVSAPSAVPRRRFCRRYIRRWWQRWACSTAASPCVLVLKLVY